MGSIIENNRRRAIKLRFPGYFGVSVKTVNWGGGINKMGQCRQVYCANRKNLHKIKKEWLVSLGMRDFISFSQEQIDLLNWKVCEDHFHACDITVSPGGFRRIAEGTTPIRYDRHEVKVKRKYGKIPTLPVVVETPQQPRAPPRKRLGLANSDVDKQKTKKRAKTAADVDDLNPIARPSDSESDEEGQEHGDSARDKAEQEHGDSALLAKIRHLEKQNRKLRQKICSLNRRWRKRDDGESGVNCQNLSHMLQYEKMEKNINGEKEFLKKCTGYSFAKWEHFFQLMENFEEDFERTDVGSKIPLKGAGGSIRSWKSNGSLFLWF